MSPLGFEPRIFRVWGERINQLSHGNIVAYVTSGANYWIWWRNWQFARPTSDGTTAGGRNSDIIKAGRELWKDSSVSGSTRVRGPPWQSSRMVRENCLQNTCIHICGVHVLLYVFMHVCVYACGRGMGAQVGSNTQKCAWMDSRSFICTLWNQNIYAQKVSPEQVCVCVYCPTWRLLSYLKRKVLGKYTYYNFTVWWR